MELSSCSTLVKRLVTIESLGDGVQFHFFLKEDDFS